jgi:hypothetical protein
MSRKPKGGRRKNLRIDQKKLDEARAILGTKTETETVETALDNLIFLHEVLAGLDRIGGKYPDWGDPFGTDEKGPEFRIPPLDPES